MESQDMISPAEMMVFIYGLDEAVDHLSETVSTLKMGARVLASHRQLQQELREARVARSDYETMCDDNMRLRNELTQLKKKLQ